MQQLINDNDAAWMARLIVEAGAVKLAPVGQPFVFNSEIKSPVKVEFDGLDKHPVVSVAVHNYFIGYGVPRLRKRFSQNINGMVFLGVPNGGTPWAEMFAENCGAESCAVEKYGERTFDPRIQDFTPNILIGFEDMLTTGGSLIALAEEIENRRCGRHMRAALAIGVHNIRGTAERLKRANIDLWYLVDFSNIFEAIKMYGSKDTYPTSDIDRIEAWRSSPEEWSERPPGFA